MIITVTHQPPSRPKQTKPDSMRVAEKLDWKWLMKLAFLDPLSKDTQTSILCNSFRWQPI
jgi:hypothetical protein